MNTFLAASAGMFAWLLVARIKDGHFTVLGACSGIVDGLVAIPPAAAYVGGLAGIAFGAVPGVCCYGPIQLKYRIGYADSPHVVGVQLSCDIVSALQLVYFLHIRL